MIKINNKMNKLISLAALMFAGNARALTRITCVGDSVTYGDQATDEVTKSYPG